MGLSPPPPMARCFGCTSVSKRGYPQTPALNDPPLTAWPQAALHLLTEPIFGSSRACYSYGAYRVLCVWKCIQSGLNINSCKQYSELGNSMYSALQEVFILAFIFFQVGTVYTESPITQLLTSPLPISHTLWKCGLF